MGKFVFNVDAGRPLMNLLFYEDLYLEYPTNRTQTLSFLKQQFPVNFESFIIKYFVSSNRLKKLELNIKVVGLKVLYYEFYWSDIQD